MTQEEDIAAEAAAETNGPTHSGFVALIGPTNAGKSTLVNRLVGAKVSIVSHKVQTTRAIVRGIAIHDNAQIVFMKDLSKGTQKLLFYKPGPSGGSCVTPIFYGPN